MRHFNDLWSQLGRYINTVETFIGQSDAALPLTDEQKRRLEQQPETELDMPVGYEEFVEATEVFPQALRRSAFVFILTLLEGTVNHLCEHLQQWYKNPVSVYDLQGRGIQRAAEYIRLVTGIAPTQLLHWSDIQDLRHIRDVLVHSNGRVRRTQLQQPAARVARSHPFVKLMPATDQPGTENSDHVIVVKLGLCEQALEKTRGFFESLLKALEATGIKLGDPCHRS